MRHSLRGFALLVAGAVGFLLTACGLDSKHPLSDEATSVQDERLIGHWRCIAPSADAEEIAFGPQDIVVGRRPDAEHELEAVALHLGADQRVEVTRMPLRATRIAEHDYLSGYVAEEEVWFLCGYQFLARDLVRVVGLRAESVRRAVETGALEGRFEIEGAGREDEVLHLDASTAALRAWLEPYDEARFEWSRAQTYVRTEADMSSAALGTEAPASPALLPVPDAYRAYRELSQAIEGNAVRWTDAKLAPTRLELGLEADGAKALAALGDALRQSPYLRTRARPGEDFVQADEPRASERGVAARLAVQLLEPESSPDLLATGEELSAERVLATLAGSGLRLTRAFQVRAAYAPPGGEVLSQAFHVAAEEGDTTLAALEAVLARLAAVPGWRVTSLAWKRLPPGSEGAGPDAILPPLIEVSACRVLAR